MTARAPLGLVVNRPYGTAPTAELLRRLGVAAKRVAGETLLFYGGPVQPEVGMVVHSTDYALADTKRITAELAVTSNPAILADRRRARGRGRRCRCWAMPAGGRASSRASWPRVPGSRSRPIRR